jgi:rhomboid protease GluP|tara:strand:- start:7220 stop:7891 length:672 start_codon:yes stop_codon:yes gene_type:complete
MVDNKLNNSLINPLPPIILIITLILILIELIFQLSEANLMFGESGQVLRNNIIMEYAFFGSLQDWMLSNGVFRWEFAIRYVTYPFIHLSFMQTLIATVMFLALGKMVCEIYNGFLFFALIFASSVSGAFFYGLILNDQFPLIGLFPAIYGLIGAYTYILWASLRSVGAKSANAFILVALLLGIQILFKFLFNGANDWIADLFGFFTGFLFAFLTNLYLLKHSN